VIPAFDAVVTGAMRPATLAEDWREIVTGLNAADATPATPSSIAATRSILSDRKGLARYLALRLKYDAAHTAVGTPPVIRVLGRHGAAGEWEFLSNVNGLRDVTLVPDIAADVVNAAGTFRFAAGTPAAMTWDLRGNTDLLVAVITAMAATNGNVALNTIQARLLPEV